MDDFILTGAAIHPVPGLAACCATKASVNMYTAVAAAGPERLRDHGTNRMWKAESSLIPAEEASRCVHARDL